jgi:hypothetical protein
VAEGIAHVVGRPWNPDAAILIDGSPVCLAAALRSDGTLARTWLRVTPDLEFADVAADIDRSGIDAEGLPVLDDGRSWSLELAND